MKEFHALSNYHAIKDAVDGQQVNWTEYLEPYGTRGYRLSADSPALRNAESHGCGGDDTVQSAVSESQSVATSIASFVDTTTGYVTFGSVLWS